MGNYYQVGSSYVFKIQPSVKVDCKILEAVQSGQDLSPFKHFPGPSFYDQSIPVFKKGGVKEVSPFTLNS